MGSGLTVNKIRMRQFSDPETKEIVMFLLKEVDDARRSAIGYAEVCIDEGLCDREECDDTEGWKAEARDLKDDELAALQELLED